MLPNHAPLMVAERFKVLEALFPGRIDLGLGRAPGTDPVTSYRAAPPPGRSTRGRRLPRALPGTDAVRAAADFRPSHPFRNVRAMPADVPLPPIFLLGSSGYSAQLAAMVGAGFSFAHHFSDYDPVAAMRIYRDHFQPSSMARARPTRSSAVAASAPTPTRRPSGSPRPSTSISCAAPRASTCRSRAPRRRSPIPIRRSTASASAATARRLFVGTPDDRRRRGSTPLIEATARRRG